MDSFSRQIYPVAQSAAVQKEPGKGGRILDLLRTTEKLLLPYSYRAGAKAVSTEVLEVYQAHCILPDEKCLMHLIII